MVLFKIILYTPYSKIGECHNSTGRISGPMKILVKRSFTKKKPEQLERQVSVKLVAKHAVLRCPVLKGLL